MPHASCNGIDIYYEIHGDGHPDPPLLCVQGITAHSGAWVLNVGAFSERLRTVIFDNRDAGRSSYADAQYRIEDMAGDALALADHLELEQFHLLGMSMGGTISQHMALAAPERIKTLTTSVSWCGGGPWFRARSRALWGMVPQLNAEQRAELLLALNLTAETFENEELRAAAVERLVNDPHTQRPEGFDRQLRATAKHDVRNRIGTLTMPVHVIGGERDVLLPPFLSKEIADLIPGARLTIMEGAAHSLHMERAAEFNDLVLGFIAEHS